MPITELNKIYCGDARDLIQQLQPTPQLIFLSPPDKNETPYDFETYTHFIQDIYTRCFDKLAEGGVLVSITTDTKNNGSIFLKHSVIIDTILAHPEAKLFNYKIWAKSLKANLYILNFCHMTFFQKGKKITTKTPFSEFYPDVWVLESDKIKGYPSKDSFPSELVARIVRTFSKEGDLILDPFIGCGKTGKVARDYRRNYIGFDLSPEFVDLANQYIESYHPSVQQSA